MADGTRRPPYVGDATEPPPLTRDPDVELSPGRGGWTIGTIAIEDDGLRVSIVTDGHDGGRDYLLLIPLLVDDDGVLQVFGVRTVPA